MLCAHECKAKSFFQQKTTREKAGKFMHDLFLSVCSCLMGKLDRERYDQPFCDQRVLQESGQRPSVTRDQAAFSWPLIKAPVTCLQRICCSHGKKAERTFSVQARCGKGMRSRPVRCSQARTTSADQATVRAAFISLPGPCRCRGSQSPSQNVRAWCGVHSPDQKE